LFTNCFLVGFLRIVIASHLEQDISFQLQIAGHSRYVVGLLPQRILLFHFGERLVQLPAVSRNHHLPKQRRAAFAVGTRFRRDLLQLRRDESREFTWAVGPVLPVTGSNPDSQIYCSANPLRRMFFTHDVSRPFAVPRATNSALRRWMHSMPSRFPIPCAPCGTTI